MVSDEYLTNVLSILKQRLGINTTVRDSYLQARIKSTIDSIVIDRNISIDENNSSMLMFLVDYTSYEYVNIQTFDKMQMAGQSGKMPEHLRQRLNNIIVGGQKNV